jgi:hypothetical protein
LDFWESRRAARKRLRRKGQGRPVNEERVADETPRETPEGGLAAIDGGHET